MSDMSETPPPNPDLRDREVSDPDSSANRSEPRAEGAPADPVSDVLELFLSVVPHFLLQSHDAGDLDGDGGESGEEIGGDVVMLPFFLFFLPHHADYVVLGR